MLFLAVWGVVGWLLRVQRLGLFMAASLPMFALLLIGCSLWFTNPSRLFRETFGFAPPASVKCLYSSYWCLGDCGHTYLHFVADENIIQRIVEAQGLSPGDLRTGDIEEDHTPRWWRPPTGPTVQVYRADFWNGEFSCEDVVLFYDTSSKSAYFRYQGID